MVTEMTSPTPLFGDYGIRGNIDGTLDAGTAFSVGMAIGDYLDGKVAVDCDGHPVSEMIASSVISGLLASGCNVIRTEVIPSEAFQYYVGSRDDIAGGIIISEPGNNGDMHIRCVFTDGLEIAEGAMDKIRSFYEDGDHPVTVNSTGMIVKDTDPIHPYVKAVLDHFSGTGIVSAGLKIVLDCCNCSSSKILLPLVRKVAGRYVAINTEPGEPVPFEESMANVKTLVKVNKADIGVIADTERVYFLTDKGVLLDDDQVFALLARNILSRFPSSSIVKTHFSSSLVKNVTETCGGKIVHSTTGIASIIDSMKEYKSHLGGENGRYIFSDIRYCFDMGMAMMQMFDCLTRFGRPSDALKGFRSNCKIRTDIDCPENYKDAALEMMHEAHMLTLKDDKDGPHIMYEDCTVHILPWIIEGKIIITAESDDPAVTESRVESISEEFQRYINS